MLEVAGECHAQSMKACILVGLVLGCSLSVAAQDRGAWKAASSTADSITGDIAISETKLSINLTQFTIAQIRKVEAAEASAVFASEENLGAGNLYRLNIPAARRFLKHNSLCGSEDTQWMVTSVSGKVLHVAFFSGQMQPVLNFEALNKSSDLCGTFTYVRW